MLDATLHKTLYFATKKHPKQWCLSERQYFYRHHRYERSALEYILCCFLCLKNSTYMRPLRDKRGHEVRVVQLDFSAAFDWLNHESLLRKLQSFGAGGPVLSILTQVLTDSPHRGCVDSCYSDWYSVQSGVSQVKPPCCSTSTLLMHYKSLVILFMNMQMMWRLLQMLIHRNHALMSVNSEWRS